MDDELDLDDFVIYEDAIFVDFVVEDLDVLATRIVGQRKTANLVSIHYVKEYANHRLVNDASSGGSECDKTLNGPGYVLVWAKK
ncbi:MAG: hypothetical protein COA91_09775 [Robiginitomaculum sp.]|nr:MAG: hypothetical protein COA91_09775 [Robiginitomaculum sp.]